MTDKEDFAREATAILNNIAFRRAIAAIELGATEAMLATDDDRQTRIARDHVKVVRGIVSLLEMAILDNKASVRPKFVA